MSLKTLNGNKLGKWELVLCLISVYIIYLYTHTHRNTPWKLKLKSELCCSAYANVVLFNSILLTSLCWIFWWIWWIGLRFTEFWYGSSPCRSDCFCAVKFFRNSFKPLRPRFGCCLLAGFDSAYWYWLWWCCCCWRSRVRIDCTPVVPFAHCKCSPFAALIIKPKTPQTNQMINDNFNRCIFWFP